MKGSVGNIAVVGRGNGRCFGGGHFTKEAPPGGVLPLDMDAL